MRWSISYAGGPAQVTIFQKKYVPAPGLKAPTSFFGVSGKITSQPFLGNPKALLQVLLPDEQPLRSRRQHLHLPAGGDAALR